VIFAQLNRTVRIRMQYERVCTRVHLFVRCQTSFMYFYSAKRLWSQSLFSYTISRCLHMVIAIVIVNMLTPCINIYKSFLGCVRKVDSKVRLLFFTFVRRVRLFVAFSFYRRAIIRHTLSFGVCLRKTDLFTPEEEKKEILHKFSITHFKNYYY
jgi:hypothetical protein